MDIKMPFYDTGYTITDTQLKIKGNPFLLEAMEEGQNKISYAESVETTRMASYRFFAKVM